VDAITKMIKAIAAIYDTKLRHQPWDVAGLPWLKIGSIIGGRGETYDLRSVSRNADLCTAFIAVSTVPGMTAETIRTDLEHALNQLKHQDPDFEYTLVHPIERKFKTWILDHPPMEMPVDEAIVQTLVASYRAITGREPKTIGLPASELNARYGDDDAHLWEAGIPAPIYGPSGGSYGEDFTYIDEMVLCSQVLTLTALDICA
jgi:acetylornithine deacetylase